MKSEPISKTLRCAAWWERSRESDDSTGSLRSVLREDCFRLAMATITLSLAASTAPAFVCPERVPASGGISKGEVKEIRVPMGTNQTRSFGSTRERRSEEHT